MVVVFQGQIYTIIRGKTIAHTDGILFLHKKFTLSVVLHKKFIVFTRKVYMRTAPKWTYGGGKKAKMTPSGVGKGRGSV